MVLCSYTAVGYCYIVDFQTTKNFSRKTKTRDMTILQEHGPSNAENGIDTPTLGIDLYCY